MSAAIITGLLVGVLCGVAYYLAARAMEVLALRAVGGPMRVGAILLGFLVRLTGAAVAFWLLIRWTDLPPVALSIGFLGAYNVVLISDVRRLRRVLPGALNTSSTSQEIVHGQR